MGKKSKKKNKYLVVDGLYNMVRYDDEYIKQLREEEITEGIETQSKCFLDESFSYTDLFEIRNGKIYTNIDGAKYIIDGCNKQFDQYEQAVDHIYDHEENKNKRHIDVNLNIDMTHNDKDLTDNQINKYISNRVVDICTSGRQLTNEDIEKLSYRDKMTLNHTISTYNKGIRAGHKSHYTRLYKCHQYVENNDPDIIYRMFYNFDYDDLYIDEYSERYSFSDHKLFRKIYGKKYKKRR